jgi:hypothetical protein|tara:strand:- start:1544 stop:1939 length:396 start_codon:yes stop_codon:yes gene_type:complete
MNLFERKCWNDFKDSANELKEYKKLLKEVDPNYKQRVYVIELKIRIDKRTGGNKEQTLDEIRGIPNITVVSIVTGTSMSNEGSYTSTLKCKYELTQGKDAVAYKKNILIPGLIGIKGLSIKHIGRPFEVRI